MSEEKDWAAVPKMMLADEVRRLTRALSEMTAKSKYYRELARTAARVSGGHSNQARRLRKELSEARAEIERLKTLAQGPATNWAKVVDAKNRADAAERCSGKWMKERDEAIRTASEAVFQKERAEAALKDCKDRASDTVALLRQTEARLKAKSEELDGMSGLLSKALTLLEAYGAATDVVIMGSEHVKKLIRQALSHEPKEKP